MLKIDRTTKTEIEEATGKVIPNPESKEFEAFYEWLVREHPELARRLEQALEVTEPYPEEAAQKQAQRREGIADTVQRMFYKQVWGKRVLNRRALSLTIFFIIFGVMMSSWSLTFFRKPSSVSSVQQPAQAPVSQTDVVTTETPPPEATNLLVVPEVQVKNSSTPEAQISPRLEVPDISDVAPPPTLPESSGSRPLQIPSIPQPLETLESEAEPVPQSSVLVTEEDARAPMSQFPVAAFEPLELATQPVLIEPFETDVPEPQPVLAFTANEETSAQNPVTELSTRSLDTAILESDTSGSSAFRASEAELATSSVLAFSPEEVAKQPTQNADLPPSDGQSTQTDIPSDLLESINSAQEANAEQVSPTSRAPDAENEGLLETDIFNGNASDLLKPGMLIPATLQKDIILTQGETRQVLADAAEDWCGEGSCPALRWLGTATLSASGRLDITFEGAILEGEVMELNGIAYGADNAEGLPAHIADTTPTLLADLLRAGAGGVTDYVEAEANRQTVTRGGDATVTEENVPGLLEFILGRAAGTLQIPEGETGVIRLAAVEKGTRLEVLFIE
jgi:hypothetical protein